MTGWHKKECWKMVNNRKQPCVALEVLRKADTKNAIPEIAVSTRVRRGKACPIAKFAKVETLAKSAGSKGGMTKDGTLKVRPVARSEAQPP